jgi:hypothetical protein
MTLQQLQADYAALDIRIAALESQAPSQLYDGAEGFAADCIGGRVDGGVDLVVDDFSDPPFTREDMLARNYKPGTLRWAMHQPIAKRIVFARPGIVRLWAPIQIINPLEAAYFTFNETRQPVTVLGCVRLDVCGESVWLNTRFRAALWNNGYRPFSGGPQSTGDCLFINRPTGKTLIKNCELSGGADELLNVKYAASDVTIQDSLFFEAFRNGNFGQVWGDDNGHNYGAILSAKEEGMSGLSVIRCGFFNLAKRCPTEVYSLPSNPRFRRMVLANCLFYNWLAPCGSFEGLDPTLMIGCHFETGPSTTVSALGYMTSGYIVDSAIKTPAGQFDRANSTTSTNPYFLRNYSTGGFATILGTELTADIQEEINTSVLPRAEGVTRLLENAGVLPLDNASKANRDSVRNGTGWQGAHPDYVSGTLEGYLTWATGVL